MQRGYVEVPIPLQRLSGAVVRPRRSRCGRRGFASHEHAGQAARGDGVGEVSRALAVDGGEGLTGGGVDEVGGG